MESRNLSTVHDAIARQCGAVVSLPDPPGSRRLHHYKSRFVAAAPQAGGMWVEAPDAGADAVEQLIAAGSLAGVSFRSGPTKIIFTSAICGYDPALCVRDGLTVEAIRLALPQKINAVQRRNDYRVKLRPEDAGVRVWRMPRSASLKDKPTASREVTALARDLSTGGMGVTLVGRDGRPPVIDPADRLRVVLNFPQISLLLEARLRHPRPPYATDTVQAGIQFLFSEDMPGRQARAGLTRIIGELQREEIRRLRLGLSA